MAKLPKKSTMKETIERCKGYAYKLWKADKITVANFTKITKELDFLKKAIDK